MYPPSKMLHKAGTPAIIGLRTEVSIRKKDKVGFVRLTPTVAYLLLLEILLWVAIFHPWQIYPETAELRCTRGQRHPQIWMRV